MTAARRTPFVGLTGAVAAGKSEALAAFGRLGAATLSADAVVHELLATERVRERLVDRWGTEVAPSGSVDRIRVGAIVFERPAELAWLEAELHPLVAERISAWRRALPAATRLAVVEVPLLFEVEMEEQFDATVCVVAGDAVRAARAGARRVDALDGRSERQLTQEEKARRATYVVENDGSLEQLEAKLAELAAQIEAVANAEARR